MALRVGCSGWSYDDWVGPFYPKDVKKEDWLSYYGHFFPTVEINSTFYSVPNAYTVKAWIKKGNEVRKFREDRFWRQDKDQAKFAYSLKLHQKITQEHLVKGDFDKANQDLRAFEAAVLDPLYEQNLVGAVLVQMGPYFRFDPEDRKGLKILEDFMQVLPTDRYDWALELRHKSWTTKGRGKTMSLIPEAAALFKKFKVMLCETDGPSFPDIRLPGAKMIYIRFHGHNQDLWFKKGAGSSKGMEPKEEDPAEPPDPKGRYNRYDYLYSEEELTPWKSHLEENFEESYVYFNNHPRGKGPKNAMMLMDILGIKHEAKDIKISSQERLF
jgi:uncharacterized protein YecE (DUF72 family)